MFIFYKFSFKIIFIFKLSSNLYEKYLNSKNNIKSNFALCLKIQQHFFNI